MIINGLILSILCSYFIGKSVYKSFDTTEKGFIAILNSWIMGLGITSILFWFFTLASNGRNHLYPFFEVVVVFILWLCSYKSMNRKDIFKNICNSLSFKQNDYIAFVLILLTALLAVGYMKFYPIGKWDSLMIWNLKAKFLADGNEGVWIRIFENALEQAHGDYPLLWCCVIARGFLFAGTQSELITALYALLLAVSFYILIYSYLKKLKNSYYGVGGLILLSLNSNLPYQCSKQYSDAILSMFIFVSIYEFVKLVTSNENKTPYLCMIFSSFCVWIKNEGIPFWFLYTALLIYKMRKKLSLSMILCFILAALPAWLAKESVCFICPYGNDLMANIKGGLANICDLKRYWIILKWYFKDLFFEYIWIICLPLVWFSGYKDKQLSKAYMLIIIPVCGFIIYACIYLITMQDLYRHLPNSFPRLVIHYIPSLAFMLALFFKPPISTQKAE